MKPKEVKYPPHRNEDESEVSTEDDLVKEELTHRYQQLQPRLTDMKAENEEVIVRKLLLSEFGIVFSNLP